MGHNDLNEIKEYCQLYLLELDHLPKRKINNSSIFAFICAFIQNFLFYTNTPAPKFLRLLSIIWRFCGRTKNYSFNNQLSGDFVVAE